MGVYRLLIARTQQPLASQARVANTFRARVIGLLGRRTLADGEGVILPACRSIHTLGMRFPIDVVFVDRAWRVVAMKPSLSPGQVVWPVWKAWGVIEMAAGTLQQARLQVGDQLRLVTPTDLTK